MAYDKALEDEILSHFANKSADNGQATSFAEGGPVDEPAMSKDDLLAQGFVPDDEPVSYAQPLQEEPPQQEQLSKEDLLAQGFVPDEPAHEPAKPQAEGAIATAGREVAHGVVPMFASLPAIGYGAAQGAAAGLAAAPFLGPAAPAGPLIGGLVGGAAGGLGAGYVVEKAQGLILKALGLDDEEQRQVNREENPNAALAGSLAPTAMAFRFDKAASLGARALGGAAMGGLSAGQQYAETGTVNAKETLASGLAGALLTAPRAGAAPLLKAGERLAGRPDMSSPTKAEDAAQVDQNDITPTARGVAAENAPVPQVEGIGNPESAAVRSERAYPKDNKSAPPKTSTILDGIPEDQRAALSSSLEGNAYKGPEETPLAGENLPLNTGIEAAAVENVKPKPLNMQRALEQRGPQEPPAAPVETEAPVKTGLEEAAVEHKPISGRLPDLDVEHARDVIRTDREALDQVKADQTAGQTGEAFADAGLPTGAKPTAYERPAPSDKYTHPDPALEGVVIARKRPVLDLAAIAPDGKVSIDPRVPPVVDVAGKQLDPALPLAVREVAVKKTMEHFDQITKDTGSPFDKEDVRLGAKQIGEEAQNKWLSKNGYEPEAFKVVLDGIKGVPKSETKPGRLRTTLSLGEEQPIAPEAKVIPGKQKALDLLAKRDDISPEAKAQIAGKLETASPEEVKKAYNSLRRKRPTVKGAEGTVQARTTEDAERKAGALQAAKSAFERYKPNSDKVPVSVADKQALERRLQEAVDHATEQYGGKDPLEYKPNVKPAEWMWLRAAKRLLDSRMTQKQIADFISNEKLLRSGDPEAVQAARSTATVEGSIARSRGPSLDMAEAAKAREFPGDVEGPEVAKKIETAADLEPETKGKIIDLSDVSKHDGEDIQADMARLAQNLAAGEDKITPKIDSWKAAEEQRVRDQAERTGKLKAAREAAQLVKRTAEKPIGASEGGASAVRKVELTPELKAKYGTAPDAKKLAAQRESMLTAAERDTIDSAAEKAGVPKETYSKPKAGEEDHSSVVPELKDLAAEFLKDNGASLNISAIDNIWRAKINPRIRWFTDLIGHQTSTKGIKAESVLAKGKAYEVKLNNQYAAETDAHWQRFIKGASTDEQIKYQLVLEKANAFDKPAFKQALEDAGIPAAKAEWMADGSRFHRVMMDEAWKAEKALGSEADYVENYISHIFEDEKGAQAFIRGRIERLGSIWYQKERSFELISDAIKAGYKLRYTNPIDVLTARMQASHKMRALVHTLQDLQKLDLAVPLGDATKAQKLWTHMFDAPDRQRWVVSPEISDLFKNAVQSLGLRDRRDKLGGAYRGWMEVKNTVIPIKLGISAFHWVHVVLNVNLAANVARELTNAASLTKGGGTVASDLARGVKSEAGSASLGEKGAYFLKSLPKVAKLSMDDALFSFPFDRYGHLGKDIREAWKTPDDKATADVKMMNRLFMEGGGVPQRNEQDLIRDRHALDLAIKDNKYLKVAPLAAQHAIKRASAWMFEEQIPNLKAAAYMRDAAALLQRRPDLINDHVNRQVALHAIMKSVDNRFGEMFYSGLFMNKVLKDVSIGSFLSLGWNLGQVREFGGAAANVVTGKGRGAVSPAQATVYDATNKGAYTLAYTATSMLSAGALSYALSGVVPTDWKDYFFPRVGGNDPEGQPRRSTTPFNTREPIMIKAHMDSEGPIGGLATFLYNKMILSPVIDAIRNRDYFGNELYDTNAPWYKKTMQLVDSLFGENFNPIAVSGYNRAKEQGGGGLKDAALSLAGFGTAPAYVNRSPMQRRLSHMYQEHSVPGSRPYQDRGPFHAVYNKLAGNPPSQAEWRSDARARFNHGTMNNDKEEVRQARADMLHKQKGGLSQTVVANMRPGEADKRKFARIPLEDQKALVKDMDQAEFAKYVVTNKGVNMANRVELIKQRKLNP